MATTVAATIIPIAPTLVPPTPPKKKVGIFQLIEPGQNPISFAYPMTAFRKHASARAQYGSTWRTLFWDPEATLAPCDSAALFNPLGTAFLDQPSTTLLKGPVRLSNLKVYGDALLHHCTVLMPFVRIRNGISVEEADERIDRMLLGWGCVFQDRKGLIMICEKESDLVGAKLAVG